jgi:hypothetical protein
MRGVVVAISGACLRKRGVCRAALGGGKQMGVCHYRTGQ